MNYLAILVAAVAAFVASAIWYMLFAKQRAALSPAAGAGRPRPLQALAELVRSIVLTSVVSYLMSRMGITTMGSAYYLALALWIGFPVILLTGSAMYEKVPWKLAAIHAGDWLIKLLLMASILALW
jgi:hypothetical protein